MYKHVSTKFENTQHNVDLKSTPLLEKNLEAFEQAQTFGGDSLEKNSK